MKRFAGKTVLITGAAQSIGRGIALCLAQEGANVVINDRANLASDDANDITGAILRVDGGYVVVRSTVD